VATFTNTGNQWMLHFDEKDGKSREIPVRHALQVIIPEYLEAAGLRNAPAGIALSAGGQGKAYPLGEPVNADDICRMMKRRLKDIRMSLLYSPTPSTSPRSVRVGRNRPEAQLSLSRTRGQGCLGRKIGRERQRP
jgi:hypothetical protein